MSESLSGTNFETKDKSCCGRHTWQWLVEGQTLGPSLAWLRISSHLLSKSFRYLQPYYPPSNFLVFSPNRPPSQLPPPMEWGSNNQERTYVLIKQNDVCFKFQKLLWRKLKILSTLTSFFFYLSFSHIHIYIHAYTFVVQKLCCGIGYVPP